MTNFNDVSTSTNDTAAGFQFEFYCESCSEKWRAPFRPYRKGQMTGWLSRLSFLVPTLHSAGRATEVMAQSGAKSAKAEALDEARQLAMRRYQQCDSCQRWVGTECWNESAGQCRDCVAKSRSSVAYGSGAQASEAAALACPNCQAPSEGGRFCHECGFDMASTHKSCPSCGSTMARQARFCGDCGHSF
jgi:hypothetical protein